MGMIELIAIVLVTLAVILAHVIVHTCAKTPNRRILALYGVPVLFLTASLITPPDILSMFVIATPASLLYLIALTVWIATRRSPVS